MLGEQEEEGERSPQFTLEHLSAFLLTENDCYEGWGACRFTLLTQRTLKKPGLLLVPAAKAGS